MEKPKTMECNSTNVFYETDKLSNSGGHLCLCVAKSNYLKAYHKYQRHDINISLCDKKKDKVCNTLFKYVKYFKIYKTPKMIYT